MKLRGGSIASDTAKSLRPPGIIFRKHINGFERNAVYQAGDGVSGLMDGYEKAFSRPPLWLSGDPIGDFLTIKSVGAVRPSYVCQSS